MIYAVDFDLEDSGNRSTLEYFEIELLSPYWKSADGTYRLSNSAYCGALFLGIL